MLGLNPSQWGSVARTILSFVSGYLVAKGYLTQDQAADLMSAIVSNWPALVAIAMGVWGAMKRSNNAMITSAANVLADPARAAAVEPDKMDELVNAIPTAGIVSRVDNEVVKMANADPGNPTTAVVTSPMIARAAAQADIDSGAVPTPDNR